MPLKTHSVLSLCSLLQGMNIVFVFKLILKVKRSVYHTTDLILSLVYNVYYILRKMYFLCVLYHGKTIGLSEIHLWKIV